MNVQEMQVFVGITAYALIQMAASNASVSLDSLEMMELTVLVRLIVITDQYVPRNS